MEYRFNSETVSVGDNAVSPHTPAMFLGEGDSCQLKTQSPESRPNFHWGGGYSGHHIPHILEWGHSRNFEHKILQAQARSFITDSLSHTTCVETNKLCLSIIQADWIATSGKGSVGNSWLLLGPTFWHSFIFGGQVSYI